MRNPASVMSTRLAPRASATNKLIMGVPSIAGIVLALGAGRIGTPWMIALGLALVGAGLLLGTWHYKRAWAVQVRQDNAAADAVLDSGETLLLERQIQYGWPLVPTLICAALVLIASVAEYPFPPVLLAIVFALIAAIAWLIAIRRARTLGSIGAEGLFMGSELFTWSTIDSISTNSGVQPADRLLMVSLRQNGKERVLEIPLASLKVPGPVVHQVADEWLHRARREAARAAGAREAARLHEHFAAHPEEEAAYIRKAFENFEHESREMRARLDQLREQAARPASIWRNPPGARPWKEQWAILAIVFVMIGLVAFGLKTDMYKSAAWSTASLYVILGGSALFSAWALFKVLPRIPRRSKVGVALIVPFMIAMCAWSIVGNALPDIYTQLAGRPFTLVQEMQRQLSPSGKGCRQRIHAQIFDEGNPTDFYCASTAEYSRLPDHGMMRARGKETWFGRHVERLEPADSPAR
jgi:hypothetical protein